MSDAADDALCLSPATELRRRLRERELSATELVDAHLRVIERVNPRLNAIVTLVAERARDDARRADRALAGAGPHPPLLGLPVAHKDFTATAGIRTTFGSPIFADHVPDHDALIVERLRGAGAVTLGKTNIPEWAAGSNCVNPVFGATGNPYEPRLTSGGSSGGAAAALACGMAALADGTDMGGSLRNPASFCNVVGLRPSPGRVPVWPTPLACHPLTVHGPMGRTVEDVALMLSAIAGPDDRSPISLSEPGTTFAGPLERDFSGTRIAWSRDLGGLPVEAEVTGVLDAHRGVFAGIGCAVEDSEPDFTGADEAFKVQRAWIFELLLGQQLDEHRELLGASVIWNVEQGRGLSGHDLGVAERTRTEIYHRIREYMADYEFIVAPATQVLPFPYEQDYPTEIAGVEMLTYVDWMKSCYFVSLIGLPAISVPCGFTDGGLPVGVQIIGRHQDDLGVLQLAHAFERETQHWRRHPPLADRVSSPGRHRSGSV
jgi:amidase